MIKNERQYRITKAQAARFAETLKRLGQASDGTGGVHPRIVQAQADAIRSQLTDLEREMREYETLRAGGYKLEKLSVVDELATVLIKARIGQGLSQQGIGGADRSQGAADPALRGDRLRSGEPCSNQRGGETRWGRRANAPLVGREGRLLEERGEPAELECCDGIIDETLGAECPK